VLFMNARVYNVLFLCTGNSARSVIAETLLNTMGQGRFRGFSAGSHPSGAVNPLVAAFLASKGFPIDSLRSKSWDEFARPDAPQMDMVITVCDQAAGESCPVWPGHPARAHWSAPDPAVHMQQPDKAREVIREVYHMMQRRISILISLPMHKLDRPGFEQEARRIANATSA
jgi:arsenate reductase